MYVFTNSSSDCKIRCHLFLINCNKGYKKYLEVAVFIENELRPQYTQFLHTERIFVTFKIT